MKTKQSYFDNRDEAFTISYNDDGVTFEINGYYTAGPFSKKDVQEICKDIQAKLDAMQ